MADIPLFHCVSHGFLKHGRLLRIGRTSILGLGPDRLACVGHSLVVSRARGLLDLLGTAEIHLTKTCLDGVGVSRVLPRSLRSGWHCVKCVQLCAKERVEPQQGAE